MSFAYKIYDQHSMYYVTFTVHQWADVQSSQSLRLGTLRML
jgi:hypothetical protein